MSEGESNDVGKGTGCCWNGNRMLLEREPDVVGTVSGCCWNGIRMLLKWYPDVVEMEISLAVDSPGTSRRPPPDPPRMVQPYPPRIVLTVSRRVANVSHGVFPRFPRSGPLAGAPCRAARRLPPVVFDRQACRGPRPRACAFSWSTSGRSACVLLGLRPRVGALSWAISGRSAHFISFRPACLLVI